MTQSTIAAIATARGLAGVAIIRISGPQAWEMARRLFSKPETCFQPGRFYHGWILDHSCGQAKPLDEVLLLTFQAPQSFTGEDVVEIHCHGGDYLSRKILDLCFQAGAEPALPGEFTRRAFLSGRLDLTQAESILDLIAAQGDAMVQLASSNLKSRSLGQYIGEMCEALIAIQSQIVASVDFPDEVEEPDRVSLQKSLQGLLQKTDALAASSQRNRLAREGLKVAILGMPNAGKSSIFNSLLATERSIVTEIAGTTRDVVTERLLIAGVPVTLIDTAGIRETEHSIEMLGIERSWQAGEDADAVFYVYDATVGLSDADQRILDRLHQPHQCRVANKVDLLSEVSMGLELPPQTLQVSSQTGQGIEALFQWLEGVIQGGDSFQQEGLALSLNQRQLVCLEAVRQNLHQAQESLGNALLPIDLTTVPLTEALRKLDELMGRDTTEDVLTQVFSQFCVGK